MYRASEKRYERMAYTRCGRSGLKLSAVSLGLWHNFGDTGVYENMRQICFTAFDNGVTHFDLANNYGPAPGSAEKTWDSTETNSLSAQRRVTRCGTALTATGAAGNISSPAWTRA